MAVLGDIISKLRRRRGNWRVSGCGSSHEDICIASVESIALNDAWFWLPQLTQPQTGHARHCMRASEQDIPNSSMALNGEPLYSPKAKENATVVKLLSPPSRGQSNHHTWRFKVPLVVICQGSYDWKRQANRPTWQLLQVSDFAFVFGAINNYPDFQGAGVVNRIIAWILYERLVDFDAAIVALQQVLVRFREVMTEVIVVARDMVMLWESCH